MKQRQCPITLKYDIRIIGFVISCILMKSLKAGQKNGKIKGVSVRNCLYLGNPKP